MVFFFIGKFIQISQSMLNVQVIPKKALLYLNLLFVRVSRLRPHQGRIGLAIGSCCDLSA